MIDAYIIDKLQREEEKQWKPIPLTIELPENDEVVKSEHNPPPGEEPIIEMRV